MKVPLIVNVFNDRENNNTSSVCILVWHFILFSIEHSMVFSRTKYKTHINRVWDIYITKGILIHKVVSGPPPSVFLLLCHSYLAASSGVIHQ